MTIYPCSDCNREFEVKSEANLKKGGAVREPGEPLCRSCTASRSKLLADLDQLPDTLDQIQALKASGGFYSKQGDVPRW